MRLRKRAWAKPELENDQNVIFSPWEYKGKWKGLFGNDYPIHLELGCGRGRFINELASANPTTNYIAIDVYYELLVHVLRKANENQLKNLKLIPINVENIEGIFAQGEIEKLYINFCNPWPNRRHHKRRLTHTNLLRQYQTILKKESEIWFKTDDEKLFIDSLEYLKGEGFTGLYITDDLHQSDFQGNIMTEYEEKFCNQGIKIKFGRFKVKS
ncbi:tRNA (guanosine(46)-N7)-methyltransferase TrmB [Desulfosporosinus hippei]|uniref:tRNA (guanine-N(7)-)-methyltransferase n=1 Tax=Desulfosporosinus hippei DSM 8344 TaxID=1121419 RepID=A0A1G7W3G2_9FIRM|nr:tRNA (guanosine(46)-N7)-methyltransferase TrmB [Desulfosporosinus hippei]SDG66552.1 tRNA (guanine-N7-)-methyltransferase [Desulfosporosinus hippei DSM 8344]